ncbi:MAG: Txe/YoeB family addiction module toxin [Roseiflexus castenholzii]|nr:MAG: Txe/YoeB family addiction module toxin [Roseiflexus castenholzii]
MIEAVVCDSFNGIDQPESLKYLGADVWSRRITQEYRLVYVITEDSDRMHSSALPLHQLTLLC